VPVALLDPEPVAGRKGAAERQALRQGDGPGRGEEQEVDGEEEGGEEVEGEVGEEGQLRPVRDDERFVDEAEGEVEERDEDLEGGGEDGEGVLEAEEGARGGDVGEGAAGEGQGREGQAEDGEVLEVPAVAFVDGVGVVDEAVLVSGNGREWKGREERCTV